MISFGNDKMFSSESYLIKIQDRLINFPGSSVIVEDGNNQVGQIELQIKHFQDKEIGYVSLFYLIEEYRGKGHGLELVKYAEQFFLENKVKEYHLRVSTTNRNALKFYEKLGFKTVCIEEQETIPRYRMSKLIAV